MPAETNTIGIVGIVASYVQTFKRLLKLTKNALLLNTNGTVAEDNDFDPCNEYDVKGMGDLPDGILAGGTIASDGSVIVSAAAGKTIIKDTDEGDKSTNYNDWSFKSENWPSAA